MKKIAHTERQHRKNSFSKEIVPIMSERNKITITEEDMPYHIQNNPLKNH